MARTAARSAAPNGRACPRPRSPVPRVDRVRRAVAPLPETLRATGSRSGNDPSRAALYSRPIECTDRDALFVLDGMLYHESDLDLEENGARLEGHMATLDTHAIARTLTDAGADPKLADAITAAVREAADHGDHVTPDQFKAGLAEMEARLTWRFAGAMLAQTGVILAAVIGAAVAILRMLG